MRGLKYKLRDRLALGASTEVLAATLRDGRQVIVKRAAPHAAHDAEAAASLAREAATAATLDHPNVVRLLGVDTHPTRGPQLVFEAIDGVDLAELAPLGTMPQDVAVYIVRELLAALDYAHGTAGILHRDVTPHNVLIAWDGAVKLTDFEVARELGSSPTAGVLIRGTPCYMSPEHLDAGELDARCDLFAVGVVLYELLTACKPYGNTRDELLVGLFGTKAVESIASQRADVDAATSAVVMKLLERRRGDRYQNACEVLEALPACPQGRARLVTLLRLLRQSQADSKADATPASDRRDSAPPPPPPGLWRHRATTAVAALGLAAMATLWSHTTTSLATRSHEPLPDSVAEHATALDMDAQRCMVDNVSMALLGHEQVATQAHEAVVTRQPIAGMEARRATPAPAPDRHTTAGGNATDSQARPATSAAAQHEPETPPRSSRVPAGRVEPIVASGGHLAPDGARHFVEGSE